jgi:hypothetical protein
MEKFGINQTSEMVTFACRLVSAGTSALEDGKVNMFDAQYVLSPLKVAGAAIKDANLIPSELGDLSEFEVNTVSALIRLELELNNEVAKDLTLEFVKLAGQLAVTLRKVREARFKPADPVLNPDLEETV